MLHQSPEDHVVYPDNVSPIRQEMMFVFDKNTPIINEETEERINCRRYESGICRICDERRGQFTPWCLEHYPWPKNHWQERNADD